MKFFTLVAVAACGFSLSFASPTLAQQAQPTQTKSTQTQQGQEQRQAVQVGQRTAWHNADQTLATCVAIGNQEEIAIAKFAEEKAHNPEVKDFARMLVKDHQAFLQKLQKFAPEATREGYLNEKGKPTENDDEKTSSKPSSRVQTAGAKQEDVDANRAAKSLQQTAGTRENPNENQVDVVQLHRELAEECIRATKEGLSKKDGKEFDECFIGQQIAAHAAMKTKLVVFERHLTGDLKQLLADGAETTEKHMKKAESIMKQLADNSTSSSKRDRSDDRK